MQPAKFTAFSVDNILLKAAHSDRRKDEETAEASVSPPNSEKIINKLK